jgi:hypothetical protein
MSGSGTLAANDEDGRRVTIGPAAIDATIAIRIEDVWNRDDGPKGRRPRWPTGL